MVKKKITIPKGSKDCQGVECNQNLEYEIEIPEATVGVTTIPTAGVSSIPTGATTAPGQTFVIQQPTEPPKQEEKKEDPHLALEKSLLDGVNYGKCKGEDCGKKLKRRRR